MRRLAFAGFFAAISIGAIGAVATACSSVPPAAPDLITIQGQVLEGSVPAVGAFMYGTNHSALAAAVGDASLFPTVAPNIADGTGHFAFFGFGPVYDLIAFPANAPRDATVVQNLTTRTPAVTLPLPQNTPLHACHIATTWVTPPPDGATIAYFVQPPTYAGVALVSAAPVDTTLADGFTATWRGSFSTTANVWALAFTRDAKTGLPSTYIGFASAYVWLIDQRESPFTISLQTTATSSLTVNLQPPSGYSVESADVALDVGEGSTPFELGHFDAPSGSITIAVPDIPANRLIARGLAKNGANVSNAGATGVAYPPPNPATMIPLVFPVATTLVSPADGATNIDTSTSFAWKSDGINEVIFTPTDPTSPTVRVVTTSQSMTLSQFAALSSANIPPGSQYSWSARRWPDFTSTDAFEAAGVDLSNANNTTSASRTFTFAK